MGTFFQTTIYGNSIGRWALAIALIIGSLLLGRLLYWLLSKVVKRLTTRTETRLDDILVDMVEEPLVVIITLWGSWLAINTLSLPEAVSNSITNIFNFAVTLLVAWLLYRLYEALHVEFINPFAAKTETDLDDHLLPILRTGIRVSIVAIGIIVALDNVGFDLAAIFAGLGLGSLAFALAAQDTVANIFGGITIFLQRPFKVGQYIVWEGQWLKTEKIGLRSSQFKDKRYSHRIIIPNSQFASNKIANATLYPGQQYQTDFILSPFITADKLELAMTLLQDLPTQNGEWSVRYLQIDEMLPEGIQLHMAYIIKEYAHRHRVRTQLFLEILKTFEANGISFAQPTTALLHSNNTQYGQRI